MKSSSRSLSCVAVAALISGCATFMPPDPQARRDLTDVAVMNWYEPCRLMAGKLMDAYGAPDWIEPGRLVWDFRTPWKRISLRNGGLTDEDTLEETVADAVPVDKRKALAAFSDKLTVSRDGRELTARSDREELNFLRVNLAHDIVRGRINPGKARSSFDYVVELRAAGKSSPEMQGLLFAPGY